MLTRVYLKRNPKEHIDYPDCYPIINIIKSIDNWLIIRDNSANLNITHYTLNTVSRVEFRP